MGVTALADLLERIYVVTLPMRVRFRGITEREVALIEGPTGWGEFGAFLEYQPDEAAHWLASALESAYGEPPPAREGTGEMDAEGGERDEPDAAATHACAIAMKAWSSRGMSGPIGA